MVPPYTERGARARARHRRRRQISIGGLVVILAALVLIFWPWSVGHSQTAAMPRVDSRRFDTVARDSVRRDSVRGDSVRGDSVAVTTPATVATVPQPGVTAGGARVHVVGMFGNPAFWILAVITAGAAFEAVVLGVIFHGAETTKQRALAIVAWTVHPFTGPDGRPSFSKIVDLLIIGAYWSGAPIPQGLAVVVVASAHGTKVLLALVDKMNLGISSADTVTRTVSQSLTPAEARTRELDTTIGRGPAGEPLRSNPPVPGATAPAEG